MLNRRIASIAVALLLAAVFVAGLSKLLMLRFKAGDVYPPYSSLRADPLGAKALHDGLDRMRGIDAQRLYRPLDTVSDLSDTTLLILGLPVRFTADREDFKLLKRLAAKGNRIVITFKADMSENEEKEPKEKKDEKKDEEEKTPRWEGIDRLLKEELGAGLAKGSLDEELRAISKDAEFESPLTWRSRTAFKAADAAWRTIYDRGGKPVVMERRFGSGTFVVAADSFFISNEGLREDRAPRFLAWLIGSSGHVVFDETHHGVNEQIGTVDLMKKYGVLPAVGVAALVALLFAWRNGQPLVPRQSTGAEEARVVTGREAGHARINLLRRAIPGRELIPACVKIWERSFAHRLGGQPEVLAAVRAQAETEAARPAREQKPVAVYRAIMQLLEKQKLK